MQTVTATVGPLATAGATKIALSQSPPGIGFIVLNGANGSFTANNIALSQSVSGASAVLLNGITSTIIPQTGVKGAYLGSLQFIYITSAGNDSSVKFTVLGLDQNGASISEVITGSNTSVSSSAQQYWSVISIKTSGSTGSTITVGSYAAATNDKARQVLITTSSTTAFIITGTNWAGDSVSETVTNAGASVASVLSYLTVTSVYSSSSPATTVSIGTNGVADSNWIEFDQYSPMAASVQANASGTVNYTVFLTMDNPNGVTLSPKETSSTITWSSAISPIIGASTTTQASIDAGFRWAKVTLNSGTGSVAARFTQWSGPPQ